MHKQQAIGLSFLLGKRSEVTDHLISQIQNSDTQVILPTSLNDLAAIDSDYDLKKKYQQIDYCITDGMPLVWYFNSFFKEVVCERMYGPDLMRDIISDTSLKYKHFFYGSSQKTLDNLYKYIKQTNDKLDIVGMISPPFRELYLREEAEYLVTIRRSNVDVLWIGLSSPKQVILAARWKNFLPGVKIFCVGAAFDFLSGQTQTAPAWVQRLGFEWLFRLISNPKRLWKRYLLIIPRFLLQKLIFC